MKRSLLASLFLSSLSLLSSALAQDVVCGDGNWATTVVINDGDSFSYKTSRQKKYGPNLNCVVTYQLGHTCQEMALHCDKFITRGCKDKLVITDNDGNRETVCKRQFDYEYFSNSDMTLTFTTNRRGSAPGAKGCYVSCTEGTDNSSSSTFSSTTTTTTSSVAVTTAGPVTAAPTTSSGGGAAAAYSQAWLRGEGPGAHVHEGVQLADRSGWVGIGELLPLEGQSAQNFKVMIRAVDSEANTLWTKQIGDTHQQSSSSSYSVGLSLVEGTSSLYAGVGLWQRSSSLQAPAVLSLDPSSGNILWTTVLGQGQSGHGAVRSCIMDGEDVVCVGYVASPEPGFKFVADEAKPAVWRLSSAGAVLTERILSLDGLGQLAKIRSDPAGGFVACSTGWGAMGGQDVNVVGVVKLSSSLDIEWSQNYGKAGGNSQVFDMLVDGEGNYLLGGHTTVGQGVVNWDYLALKVNSQTRAEEWRRTYGQPRGFDARYIHDEMYGVALDNAGNYLLLGGSGDEYDNYNVMGTGQWSGWASDTWGSYLVVVSPSGEKLYENYYGKKGGNNAGEWLSYDKVTGDIMVYTDSDTQGGFGFLKLTPA